MAKGLTNGAIPMGAVAVQSHVHDALMQGPEAVIELFHGYTYSGHPAASAALIATLDIYRREALFDRARDLESYWQDSVHSLRQSPGVIDVRDIGLVGAVELAPVGDRPGARGYQVFCKAFEKGLLVRFTGDTIALSPPLVIAQSQIDELVDKLAAQSRSPHESFASRSPRCCSPPPPSPAPATSAFRSKARPGRSTRSPTSPGSRSATPP